MMKLTDLSTDLVEKILNNCDYNTILNYYKTNKIQYSIKNMELLKRKKQINLLKNNFPIFFHNIINFDSIIHAAKINLNNRMGFTGYIDFISYNDFKENNSNILYGYDCVNRFFISIMYDVDSTIFHKKPKNKIITFFQRYSDNNKIYVNCGTSFIYYSYVNTYNFLQEPPKQYQILFNLLNNNKAHYNHENDDSVCKIINYKLSNIL
jgi:hypothetical protein